MNENATSPDLDPSEFPDFWAGHVNQGRLDELVALYRNDAVLTPTFSPDSAKGEADLRRYFDGLAAREGLRVDIHEGSVDCTPIDESRSVITGTYDFNFEVDGALRAFPSRFTFVIDLAQESPILHHHSSQIPSSP